MAEGLKKCRNRKGELGGEVYGEGNRRNGVRGREGGREKMDWRNGSEGRAEVMEEREGRRENWRGFSMNWRRAAEEGREERRKRGKVN